MRANKLLSEIKKCLLSDKFTRAICVLGEPGCGKTSIVQQVASSLDDWGYIEKHMPTMLVEDFGVPLVDSSSNVLRYLLPDWYPAEDRTDIPDRGVLCFDDRTQANQDLQKVLANIIQARTLHGVPLKKGWRIVSTGNRLEDRSGVVKQLLHLNDRESKLTFETVLEDWADWALNNNVLQQVISFLYFKPNLLHDFDPKRDINATPRGWVEGVSNILDVGISKDALPEFIKGAIGEGASAEFMSYLEICEQMPDPLRILREPKIYPTEDEVKSFEMSVKYALSGALAEHVDEKTIGNMIVFLERLEPEFGVVALNYVSRKKPELQETDAYNAWIVKNQQYIIR